MTAEEHWLPPDNVQEVPGPTIANRTSPTNMGLALLANLAAAGVAAAAFIAFAGDSDAPRRVSLRQPARVSQ